MQKYQHIDNSLKDNTSMDIGHWTIPNGTIHRRVYLQSDHDCPDNMYSNRTKLKGDNNTL